MNALDDYVGRCRALVFSVADELSEDDFQWVLHLIDHDEPPEAMCSLAWELDKPDSLAANDLVAQIRDLIGGLVPDESLPMRFRASEAE